MGKKEEAIWSDFGEKKLPQNINSVWNLKITTKTKQKKQKSFEINILLGKIKYKILKSQPNKF